MTKETAYYPRLETMTDEWMDLFGYWAPTVVTDTPEEYRAVRETAGLMDFGMLRKVDLEGEGAIDIVNAVVARDVSGLATGRMAYGPLCNEQGKMIDDCTVMRLGERIRFCGANDKDLEIFAARCEGTGVTMRVFTDDVGHLCVQGPRSRDILQPITSTDLSNEAFPYYTCKDDIEVGGIPGVFMPRLGYTAELGWELWVERDRALELWDVLVEAGESHGMKVIGMNALDLFRIEGGFIIGGVEYDETVSPYECGLGWAVALDKGEFLGRDALAGGKDAARLRLASVTLESGGDAASGAALVADGEEVGLVTQAIVSPYLGGRTLGLAKVRTDLAQAGTKVEARIGDELVAGEVVRHPVYEPERKRVKEG